MIIVVPHHACNCHAFQGISNFFRYRQLVFAALSNIYMKVYGKEDRREREMTGFWNRCYE